VHGSVPAQHCKKFKIVIQAKENIDDCKVFIAFISIGTARFGDNRNRIISSFIRFAKFFPLVISFATFRELHEIRQEF